MAIITTWILTQMGHLQIVLAGTMLLVNCMVIRMMYGSSTSLPVYILLHLYNAITPALMALYGRKCRTLSENIGILSQQGKLSSSPAFFRSILLLLITGVVCSFLILTGKMGNESASAYRTIGDFRNFSTHLHNMMRSSNTWLWSSPREEEGWITTLQGLLRFVYGISMTWLMLLPVVLFPYMDQSDDDHWSDQDDPMLGKDTFAEVLGGGAFRSLLSVLFIAAVSFLLCWMPLILSFVLHVLATFILAVGIIFKLGASTSTQIKV